jgi:hypothetical protein
MASHELYYHLSLGAEATDGLIAVALSVDWPRPDYQHEDQTAYETLHFTSDRNCPPWTLFRILWHKNSPVKAIKKSLFSQKRSARKAVGQIPAGDQIIPEFASPPALLLRAGAYSEK